MRQNCPVRENVPVRDNYGKLLPGLKPSDLSGKLIVIEGTDGAGRTTQIDLLKPWLEEMGHAVLDTGMARSSLAGDGIRRAKEGNNLGRVTQSLFYATDFFDRLENEIIPALRAGFVVLTDRYIYSLMARAVVRGVDPQWVRKLYRMALKPDAVFYLRLGVEQLVPRVVFSRGFDYWESGMDFSPARDMYEGFCNYQKALLAEFDRLSAEYSFEVVDAAADAKTVFGVLKARISKLLAAAQEHQKSATAAQPAPVAVLDQGGVAAKESALAFATPGAVSQATVTPRQSISSDAEFEWLLVLAEAHQQAWCDPTPFPSFLGRPLPTGLEIPPVNTPVAAAPEVVFELKLPPIATQIEEAFARARQAMDHFGREKLVASLQGNGHSNGHSNGNGNGHTNGHHLP